jgi:hypothetical protein
VDPAQLSQSSFAALTFIAAPALLTNASSVLALSTTNRMLRTRDIMREALSRSETQDVPTEDRPLMLKHVARLEIQAGLLMSALGSIYMALGSFAGATLITLLAAALPIQARMITDGLGLFGMALGALGVGCLIFGSVRLFQATRLSMLTIRDEANQIRGRLAGPGV